MRVLILISAIYSTKFISKIIVNFYFDVENLDMSFVL